MTSGAAEFGHVFGSATVLSTLNIQSFVEASACPVHVHFSYTVTKADH